MKVSDKPDAQALWDAISTGLESPRKAGQRLGIHPKRVVALCLKWEARKIYEYGVSADLGWVIHKNEKR